MRSKMPSGRQPRLVDRLVFNRPVFAQLGINDEINDTPFTVGQRAHAADTLGDNLDKWDEKFKEEIHGVILVAASHKHILDKAWGRVKNIFQVGKEHAGIIVVKELAGQTRPGSEDGHEHFGFNDGLSQPSIQGVNSDDMDGIDPPVRQGIILLGREGDDGFVEPGQTSAGPVPRPSWAIDGSFLAFRYLKQLVPEFDDFLERNALDVGIGAPPNAGKDLLGARLVGRWKSGAPVQLAPIQDDPSLAVPGKNQDFRFSIDDQERCPFAAHIRKTNPRGDLPTVEIRRILRRGITFGPEVTPKEKTDKKSSDDEKLERGLLFACYQSNIANGFEFIQNRWANQKNFPPGANVVPGFDPLIGVPLDNSQRDILGSDPKDLTLPLKLEADWVVSRGGEYFFSPSISALKGIFAKKA